MLKILSPYTLFNPGDVRIVRLDTTSFFLQDYGPDGWQCFQMAPKQTLTYCIGELYSAGYAYLGRHLFLGKLESVYYYRQAGTDCA